MLRGDPARADRYSPRTGRRMGRVCWLQAYYTGSEALARLHPVRRARRAGRSPARPAPVVLREMLYPNLVIFQLIPKIALAPLFVIWLGIDAPSRLVFFDFHQFLPRGDRRADRADLDQPQRRSALPARSPPRAGRFSAMCRCLTRCRSFSAALKVAATLVGDRHRGRRIHLLQTWARLDHSTGRIACGNSADFCGAAGALHRRPGALRNRRLGRNPGA